MNILLPFKVAYMPCVYNCHNLFGMLNCRNLLHLKIGIPLNSC